MREFLTVIVCLLVLGTGSVRGTSTYLFYRELGDVVKDESPVYFQSPWRRRGEVVHTRRVFGGRPAKLSDFPPMCVLLDRYMGSRCSGAVLSSHWALTAAHCASSAISYIKYNTRLTGAKDGDVVAVHYLYRHPEFSVLQEDLGRGMDVTMLHHDVGLVRTRDKIKLLAALPPDPLANIRRYDPMSLVNEEVQVLGFGHTEKMSEGEELCGTRLRLISCGRKQWYHVVCGTGDTGGGVCAGDSGGPVVFGGAQLAVTSMGPKECAHAQAPAADAFSVFTTLRPYVDILNATISDTDRALTMRMISTAPVLRSDLLFNAIFAFLLRAFFLRHHAS